MAEPLLRCCPNGRASFVVLSRKILQSVGLLGTADWDENESFLMIWHA